MNVKRLNGESVMLTISIASLLLSFMIKTFVLRIVYALSFSLLMPLLAFLIFSDEERKTFYKLKVQIKTDWIIYGIAIMSSVAVLLFPVTKYTFDDILVFFMSLDIQEAIRIVSGYFILTIFPGYATCRVIALNKLNSSFERLAFTFALSYVISVVLGLTLSQTIGISPASYLCSLWIYALLCEVLRYMCKRKYGFPTTSTIQMQSAKSNLIGKSAMVLICLVLLFSAYFITLSGDPADYALGGDVAEYVLDASAFLQNLQIESAYLWFQIFIGIASMLTGLHPLHAFVGMQFLIILFPLSFYTLLLNIFKDNKIAAVGTVVTTVTGGLSSIGILGLSHAYNEQNVFAALIDLRAKTQNWPWLSNHFFIVATMDWSLLLLSFSFICRFLEEKRSNNVNNLVFGSLFLASTFFTHSVLSLMICLITVLTFSVFSHKYLKKVSLFFLSVFIDLVVLNIVSYNFFIDTLFNYYLHYKVFFAGSELFPYHMGMVTILVLLFFMLSIPRVASVLWSKIKPIKNIALPLKLEFISLLCIIFAFVFTIIPLATLAVNFTHLHSLEETIFPWFVYIVRFSPLLQLAVLSVPSMVRMDGRKRIGSFLMISWCLSAILALGLNALFPKFATAMLVNRWLMSIYLPLGALSGLMLCSLNAVEFPKIKFRFGGNHVKIYIKKLLTCILIISLAFSFLSYAYSIELFYQGNISSSMPDEEKDLYTYLLGLPPGKVFLTYSSYMYRRISSLTMHKTYAYYQYGTFTSWPVEILFKTSSPEIASYFLYKLGITHIVLTRQDWAKILEMMNSALVSMLNFFPIVFNNSFATVYSVPPLLANESSNYLLVKPLTKFSFDLVSEPLIFDQIKPDNLRIVGGPSTFKVEKGVIVQQVQDIKPPSAQYLQLYRGLSIPMALSPVVSFEIRGTGNALYNIGFYSQEKGWYWLSREEGFPSSFFRAPNNWTEMKINLQDILGKDAVVLYVDFVATSLDGATAEVEWKDFSIYRMLSKSEWTLNIYNLAHNSLTVSNLPFAVVNDYGDLSLDSSNVYILPNSLPFGVSGEELINYAKRGAHIVLLCASPTFDENSNELLNLLGIELKGVALINGICIDERVQKVSSNLYVTDITVQNSPYTHNVIGNYVTSENESIPFMINFAIGNGSVVFVNLPKLFNLDRTLADITVKAIKKAAVALPKPILSNVSKTPPYPDDLFKLGNPNLLNIYKLKGLVNYIYAFSDIKLEGNITMSSDYVILNGSDVKIRKLSVQNSTYQEVFENVSVLNLEIAGPYDTTVATHDAIVYRSGDKLSIVGTFSLNYLRVYVEKPIILNIERNGEDKNLTVSKSYVEFEFFGNNVVNLRLEKPLILLDPGSLDTNWKGVLWSNGKMFTTVAKAEHWIIDGKLFLQVLNCNEVITMKVLDKENIGVTVND